jgi:hypothetical protein
MNEHIRFGKEREAVFRTLPQVGPLFPKLNPMREARRTTGFARARRRLTIKGIRFDHAPNIFVFLGNLPLNLVNEDKSR